MKPPIIHTPIKYSKDTKGYTIHCTATINGEKKRLRKRVKEDDIDELIEYWNKLFLNGVDPTNVIEERKYHNLTTDLTLSQGYSKYLDHANITGGTLNNIDNKMILLVNKYGQHLLKDITAIEIEGVINEKIKNRDWVTSTVKNAKNVYSSFFNWCVRARYITENPTKYMNPKMKSDKDAKVRYTPISDEHLPLIMNAVKNKEDCKNLYLFVCLIYHAHLRPKEVRNLKVGDIDLVKKIITVKASIAKTNTKETVNIFPALEEVLTQYNIQNRNKTENIFKPNSQKYFYDHFKSVLETLKLDNEGYSAYCFKHTSNIHKVTKNGWKIEQIQKHNRHSSLAITMEYLKKLGLFTDMDNLESSTI